MAKFRCLCGQPLSTSGSIPNPDEWHCLSDADFDAVEGLVNAEDLYTQSTIMYRCPASGHLWCSGTASRNRPRSTRLRLCRRAGANRLSPQAAAAAVMRWLLRFVIALLSGRSPPPARRTPVSSCSRWLTRRALPRSPGPSAGRSPAGITIRTASRKGHRRAGPTTAISWASPRMLSRAMTCSAPVSTTRRPRVPVPGPGLPAR